IFKYTYELKPLDEAQTLQALHKPAALKGDFNSPQFTYGEEAIQDILYGKKKQQDGEKQLIEPFQLQLLGQHAEEKIIAKKEKEERRAKYNKEQPVPQTKSFELDSKDLGDPKKIYQKHYQRSIATLPIGKRPGARKLIEKNLIIEGNRVPLPEAVIVKQHKVSTKSLEDLLDKRLLRSELNTTQGTSYELSHDSLIAPIQEAAEKRKRRRLWFVAFGIIGLLLLWGIYERNRANNLASQLSNGIIINPLVIATVDPPSGPAPLDVTFTYRITDSLRNKVKSIWWEFGDGSSSSADSVLHRYDKTGDYEVRLIIIDNNGRPREDLLTITVLPPDTIQSITILPPEPTPIILELIADPSRGTDSLDIFFKYRIRKDTILEFKVNNVEWDFGDGEFSSLDSLTHSYTKSDKYVAKVTVSDISGVKLERTLIIDVPLNDAVISPSSIEIGMDPPNGRAPLTVQFYLSDTIPQRDGEYVWKINDSVFSRSLNPSFTFQRQGTYSVELEIENNNSLKIAPRDIVIGPGINPETIDSEDLVPLPVAIALVEQAEGVAPFEVKFRGDSSTPRNAGLTYYWHFRNNSTSDLQNPSYTFDSPGPYEVILTVTDTLGRVDLDTVPISVKSDSPPTARAVAKINSQEINFQKSAIDNIIEGVAPFTVEFNAEKSVDDVKVERYEWDFDDGVTLSGAKRKHTFIEAKEHNVRLIVEDNRGQSDTVSVKIKVTYKSIDPVIDSENWLKRFIGIQDQNLDSIRDETNSWRKHIIPRDSLNLVVITMDDSPKYATSGNNELPHLLFFFTRRKVFKFRNIINPYSINEMRTERYSLQSLIKVSKRNAKRNARNGNDTISRKFMKPDGTVDIFRSDSEDFENLAELFEKNKTSDKAINFYYTRFPYSYFSQAEQNVLDNYYLVLGQPKE
ncbi:MAG: PKD domain-containing protein, partial [Flavobacteriaceae bacterium]|nr:PKD domain-containing protein [Flavobacteriaceae bacterium]